VSKLVELGAVWMSSVMCVRVIGSSLVSNCSHILGGNLVRILDYELLEQVKQLMTLVDYDLQTKIVSHLLENQIGFKYKQKDTLLSNYR
jgi:hypothetical protein